MKFISIAVVLLFSVNNAVGHYIFQQCLRAQPSFLHGSTFDGNTNPAWLQNAPVTDLASKDLRCNVGGEVSNGTETLTVQAGDAFTFTLDTAVYHQGPISLYMSKAPGNAADYDGGGAWFKIYDWGPSGSSWPLRISYTSNIPTCIPNGEYLLRIQSLGIHNPGSLPQFYMSCAQIKVTGGGSAVPSPTATIPGAFRSTDPGYTANIYNGGTANYVIPGPKVFTC